MAPFNCKLVALYSFVLFCFFVFFCFLFFRWSYFPKLGRSLAFLSHFQVPPSLSLTHCTFLRFAWMDPAAFWAFPFRCPTDNWSSICPKLTHYLSTPNLFPILYHHFVPTHSFSAKPKPEAVHQLLPSFLSYVQYLFSHWVLLILLSKCLPYLELVHESAVIQRVGSASTDSSMISQIASQKNTYPRLEQAEFNTRPQIYNGLNARIYKMIGCLTPCIGTDVSTQHKHHMNEILECACKGGSHFILFFILKKYLSE